MSGIKLWYTLRERELIDQYKRVVHGDGLVSSRCGPITMQRDNKGNVTLSAEAARQLAELFP